MLQEGFLRRRCVSARVTADSQIPHGLLHNGHPSVAHLVQLMLCDDSRPHVDDCARIKPSFILDRNMHIMCTATRSLKLRVRGAISPLPNLTRFQRSCVEDAPKIPGCQVCYRSNHFLIFNPPSLRVKQPWSVDARCSRRRPRMLPNERHA